MSVGRDLAILWSERLSLPRLVGAGLDGGLTTILFHHFRFDDESWNSARDRLRRQLGYLAEAFDPVTLEAALGFLDTDTAPGRRPLLVTIDDAKRENLEVADLFQTAGLPVVHFVCAGWSALADPDHDDEAMKLRLAARLHFYGGDALEIGVRGEIFTLDRNGNARLIDAVIAADATNDLERLADLESALSTIADPTAKDVCNWSELRDLQGGGATIGVHSVSHPKIAKQTPLRQRFEIEAAHSYISARLGPCRHFAYPYGTPDSHDDNTRSILADLGIATAFVTRPAIARPGNDIFRLPRLVMPDRPMSDAVFRARSCGGGVPLNLLKELFL